MGSSNTSCFVSQQTISSEDESVIIPIMQQATYNPVAITFSNHEGIQEVSKYGYSHSSCYPTSFWGYAGPLIKGKYDDYGQFNLVNSEENKKNLILFFNSLSENVCDVKEGENTTHEIPFSFSKLYKPNKQYKFSELEKIWSQVWTVAQKFRLFARNYKNEPVPMAFAVMHQCVADYLVDELSKGEFYSGESLEPKSYFHEFANKNFTNKMKYFENHALLGDMLDFFIRDIAGLQNFRLGEQEDSFIDHYYRESTSFVDKFVKYAKQNPGSNNISKEFSDEIFEDFKTQIEHRYIAVQLNRYNIKLTPMVYAGQDYDNDIGNSYLELIKESNKLVKQILKDKKEEKSKSKYKF